MMSFYTEHKKHLCTFAGIITVTLLYFVFPHQNPSTKKIMFVASTETIGGKGVYELYKEMKKVGHEVKIALYPSIRRGEVIADVDTKFAKKFDSNEVFYPCGMEYPYTKCDTIESSGIDNYKPDYIFTQNPYYPEMNASLRKMAKQLVHIVYGPYLFYQNHVADPHLPDLIDTVFVDSEAAKEIFIRDYAFPKNRVVVSGYQSYKEMRDLRTQPAKHEQETILWLPRWRLSFKDRERYEGGSTFLNYHYFFYNYAASHPEIHLIIRPHINLFQDGVVGSFFNQRDIEKIFNKFRSLKNVTISMHKERELIHDIYDSDLVIADGTSALGEVVVDDKPIIYLSNGWNYEFTSNPLSQALEKYVYLAYEPNDVMQYMDVIRQNEYRPLYDMECVDLKCKLSKMWCNMLNKACNRGEFKKLLDPVENPAEFIANYLLYN